VNQLDLVIKSIQSAKSANQAALHALTAVEQMLMSANEEQVADVEEQEEQQGCSHENAIEVSTLTGEYRICECGEQFTI
jgi:hypothetical protein